MYSANLQAEKPIVLKRSASSFLSSCVQLRIVTKKVPTAAYEKKSHFTANQVGNDKFTNFAGVSASAGTVKAQPGYNTHTV